MSVHPGVQVNPLYSRQSVAGWMNYCFAGKFKDPGLKSVACTYMFYTIFFFLDPWVLLWFSPDSLLHPAGKTGSGQTDRCNKSLHFSLLIYTRLSLCDLHLNGVFVLAEVFQHCSDDEEKRNIVESACPYGYPQALWHSLLFLLLPWSGIDFSWLLLSKALSELVQDSLKTAVSGKHWSSIS